MTTVLLMLVLILMVVLPLWVKDDRALVGQIRVGLLVVAGLLLVVRLAGAPPNRLEGVELSDSRNWAVGWKLGQFLCEQFPDGGKVAVFVNNAPREGIMATTEALLDGLDEGSREVPFELEVLRPAENARVEFMDLADAKDMKKLIEAQGDRAVAIVSFIPFPFKGMKSVDLPPVLVWDQQRSGYWKSWMKHGKVAAAAYPNKDYERWHDPELQRGSPEQQFSAVHDLITPDSLSSVTER